MESTDASPGFSPADRDWLEVLCGGVPESAEASDSDSGAAALEARLLREALVYEKHCWERSDTFGALNTPASEDAGLQSLLKTLRGRGLLEGPKAKPTRSARFVWWPAWGTIGVSLGAVLALSWPLFFHRAAEFDEAPVWRGDQTQELRPVVDPRAAALTLKNSLDRIGVFSALYREGADLVLDLDVDPLQLADVTPQLVALGLPVQAGQQRIRFTTSKKATP